MHWVARSFCAEETDLMNDPVRSFGEIAGKLARNPLGIIALFIVLIYGLATATTIYAGNLTPSERLPLTWFLVLFPVLVLLFFIHLVIHHSDKLYGPGDFRDEANYMKLKTAALLGAATTKNRNPATDEDIAGIVDSVQVAGGARPERNAKWKSQVLWVDDRPENNYYERQAFEAIGLQFTLAQSTDEALEKLTNSQYAAIISDMGRREGPREGYVLLDRLRSEGNSTPLFFYASSNAPEHERETLEHGGQGNTNNPQELFDMVTRAVIRRQSMQDV